MTTSTLVCLVIFLGAMLLAVVAAKPVVPGCAVATLMPASTCHDFLLLLDRTVRRFDTLGPTADNTMDM